MMSPTRNLHEMSFLQAAMVPDSWQNTVDLRSNHWGIAPEIMAKRQTIEASKVDIKKYKKTCDGIELTIGMVESNMIKTV